MRKVHYRIMSDVFKNRKAHTEKFHYFFPKEMELEKNKKTGVYEDVYGEVEFVVEKKLDNSTKIRWHQIRLPLFGYKGITSDKVKMAVPVTPEEFERMQHKIKQQVLV